MLKNILSNLFCLFLIGLILPAKPVFASLEFTSNYKITYHIGPRGDAKVNQEISLKNNFSNIYPKSYYLEISGNEVKKIQAEDSQGSIIQDVERKAENTLIKLQFNDKSVGKNEKLFFNVSYEIPQLAKKQGQIWHLNIPSLSNFEEINDLELIIEVPANFGSLAYSSINPYKTEQKETQILTFLKSQLDDKSISLIFGKFQLFDFELKYFLQNTSAINPSEEKIPLPHNTNYQTVVLSQISPEPQKIIKDKDNNWLAIYSLLPNEAKNILITGQAKIYADPQKTIKTDQTDFSIYLEEDQFWPVKNSIFQNLATEFNNVTEIYNFVVNHLDYDYETLGNTKRKGALAAYQSQSGVCTEFSDLFVTLARAKGIPARELQGFAFTNNKEIVSLSADNDVLHSWAEYWDKNENRWIPVDPTWTKTTGGLDFIKGFDLGHFVFVTHGQSSINPNPPGFYKTDNSQKNVNVDFATDILPSPELKITPELVQNPSNPIIKVKNTSLAAVNQLNIKLSGWSGSNQEKITVDSLPPYGETEIEVTSPKFWQKIFTSPKYEIEINQEKYQLEWGNNNPIGSLKLQIKRVFANLLKR